MQRNQEYKQDNLLVKPLAAEERLFSENFIQFQLDLATSASQAVTRSNLLEERKIIAIMNYMRDLYANTQTSEITGKVNNKHNYCGLLFLLDEAMRKLSQHYQWSGTHPLLPALEKIKKNIVRYVAITQPQFILSEADKKANTPVDDDPFDVIAIDNVVQNQHVFSDNFLQQQALLIMTASRKVTDEGVLEQESVRNLLAYMQDLFIHAHDGVIVGGALKNRNYDALLKVVDDFSDELKNSYHWNKMHPLLPTLKQIKKNIQDYIGIAQPQFSQKVQLGQGDNQSSIASSRFEIIKDTCGILACLAWTIPEKVITLDNGCETVCGPEEACCSEVPLPKENLYCNLWAPKNSMKAFCQDVRDQSKAIDDLKAAPIRHTMS
jgi:hypothetical protein